MAQVGTLETMEESKAQAMLMKLFESGATIIPVTGGYSGEKKTVVYFVVNRFQIAKMKEAVHAVDPKAYMTISEVADVFKSAH